MCSQRVILKPKDDFEDIILNDEKRQIYKRIIIQKDKVIGAVLFGDTEDGVWYAELICRSNPNFINSK